MFTIINTRTGKFLFGTDYRYHPPRQRTSDNQMVTYETLQAAKHDFLHRRCGRDYKIACLKTIEVKRLIDPPKDYNNIYSEEVNENESEKV